VTALVSLQHPEGRWHTVLDDPTSPIEASTPAFFASGVLKARRLALLSDDLAADPVLERMLERAVAALVTDAGADGGLPISDATPVGDRATYVERSIGVFPWGQGPLVLTFTESRLAAAGGPA
jgi:unsaturated rhamnogalacturonyl hydrolase